MVALQKYSQMAICVKSVKTVKCRLRITSTRAGRGNDWLLPFCGLLEHHSFLTIGIGLLALTRPLTLLGQVIHSSLEDVQLCPLGRPSLRGPSRDLSVQTGKSPSWTVERRRFPHLLCAGQRSRTLQLVELLEELLRAEECILPAKKRTALPSVSIC